MDTMKTENDERSPQNSLQSTNSFFSDNLPSLMLENREPLNDASSIIADEVEDVRPYNRALSLGLPPLRMTNNGGAQNGYLRNGRLADYFSLNPRGGQPPAYHPMNGQEQARNPVIPQHSSHTFQNTVDRMAPEMVSFKKNLGTFTQNANNFVQVQTQLFDSLNTRLVRAEDERNRLRAALSQYQHQYQQFGSCMTTPQAAPEFGSCMTTPQTAPEGHASLLHDVEDAQVSSPMTPCKPLQETKHDYSSPIQRNTSETPFGSKLTGTNRPKGEKTRARKALKIKVPGQLATDLHHSSSSSTTTTTTPTPTPTLTSPLTPGRIGPPNPHPPRPTTIISKRKIHNLEKLLPSASALIPLLPLTDTEIIVYFFQSLARPIVSLRLYARNWGPSNICDTLNAHRAIQGGYLRNTASVKCTTAIKRGKERFGDAWADELRHVFAHADDLHATDLMHWSAEEKVVATDFRVRDLSRELKMHPRVGVDGGVFTECVKWCVERRAGYTLANVHELALALRRGEEPVLEEEESGEDGDNDDDES